MLPNALTINPQTQQISPITNVFRQFADGGATPALRVTDIQQANTNFQAKIPDGIPRRSIRCLRSTS